MTQTQRRNLPTVRVYQFHGKNERMQTRHGSRGSLRFQQSTLSSRISMQFVTRLSPEPTPAKNEGRSAYSRCAARKQAWRLPPHVPVELQSLAKDVAANQTISPTVDNPALGPRRTRASPICEFAVSDDSRAEQSSCKKTKNWHL